MTRLSFTPMLRGRGYLRRLIWLGIWRVAMRGLPLWLAACLPEHAGR